MNKNGLAPESSPDERPQKRQRLAPPPPTTTTSTPTNPSTSINSDSHQTSTATTSSSANITPSASKMEQDNNEGVINQMVAINTDDRERECEVGIVHFVNVEQKGFTGILKQRYTDFLVNEIALDGTVRHLISDCAPNFAAAAKAKEKENARPEVNETNAESAHTVTQVRTEPDVETVKQESADDTENQAHPQDNTPTPSTEVQPNTNFRGEVGVQPTAKIENETAGDASTTSAFSISPQDDALIVKYFNKSFKDEILQFHAKILAKPNAKHNSFGSLLSPPFTDRVLRGKMHADMRRIFESRLETLTLDDGVKISAMPKGNNTWHGREGTVIQQQASSHRGQRTNQIKGKLGWQDLGGEYLHFNLLKENRDTMEVIGFMTRGLKIGPKDFAFAGTKDRRAVTVQRVSVFRQYAKDLVRQNNYLKGGRIGDYKYEKFPLKLGELNGNLFTIALRDCHFEGEDDLDLDGKVQLATSVMTDALKHFEADGFLNYFGLQRFGTFGIGTHDVGKLILKGDFQGAVKSILTYNPDLLKGDPNSTDKVGRDDISRARAINLFEQTGFSRAPLEELPKKFSAEVAVIRHLGNKRNSEDFIGALHTIPRNLKSMYVHAYQSLVWNTIVSERWARYGTKVVEGDLVIVDVGESKAAQVKDEVDQNGEVVIHAADGDTAAHLDEMFERARPLSKEEAESGKYTIFDIVLPTPGYDIEYPANDIGDYYKEFMASERGGGLDPSDMRRSERDFSLSGNYRKLLSQAKDLSFEIKTYHSDTEQLAETDLDILDKDRPKPKERDQSQQHGRNDFYGQRGNSDRGRGRGRGGLFQNNDRGSRGGYSQNSRDGYGQNSRGGYGQNSRGGRGGSNDDNNRSNRIYRDIRLEEAEEAQKLAEANGTSVQLEANATAPQQDTVDEGAQAHAEILSAWGALPAKLLAEGKAAGEVARLRRENPVEIDPSTIIQADIRETFIQTDLDENGRRNIKSRTTTTLSKKVEADVAQTDLPKVDVEASAVEETSKDEEMTDAPSLPIEISEPIAVTSLDEKVASTTSTPKKSTVVEEVEKLPSPIKPAGIESSESTSSGGGVLLAPKIAVVMKFALGTSQYATMALRELMKAGGVKTYKPDYSSGR